MAVVGLVIGVGWAHETLHQRGIAELAVGWLAGGLSVETSWSIHETTSVLILGGEPSDLEHVLRTLRERLALGPSALDEHKIVAGSDIDAQLLRYRYGNGSYGLAGASRYGYRTVTPSAVRDWLSRIGSNTCLSFTAEIEPEPLGLRDVPALPEPPREQVLSPGTIRIDQGIGLSWLADRTPTAGLATEIMITAAASVVPAPTPTSRGVSGRYRSLGADARHVGLVTTDLDASPDLTAPILDQVERLCTHGPEELEIVNGMDVQARSTQLSNLDQAIAGCTHELWHRAGYRMPPESELTADPETLRSEISRQVQTMLVFSPAIPDGSFLAPAADAFVLEPAAGSAYLPARSMIEVGVSPQERMIVDDRRLTYRGGREHTVSTETTALVERRPDGERIILDRSGFMLTVDPLLWRRGRRLVGWVDQHLPQQVVREEPLPANPYVSRAALRARPGVLVAMMVISALLGVIFIGSAVDAPEDRGMKLGFGIAFLAVEVVWWKLMQHTRRLRRRAGLRR